MRGNIFAQLIKVDNSGKITAKELYEFLELDLSNYSKWAKSNILENQFAEVNVDFIPFVQHDERNPKPTTNYRLSINIILYDRRSNQTG